MWPPGAMGWPHLHPPSHIHTAAEEAVGEEMAKQMHRKWGGRPEAEVDEHDR